MKTFRYIRSKLLALVLVATFCALFVACGIFLWYDIKTYRNAIVSDAQAQVELLSYTTLPALQFGDERVARENLELLSLKSGVEAAAIYNSQGQVFVSFSRDATAQIPPLLPEISGVHIGNDRVDVYGRITDSDAILGTVWLSENYQPFSRALEFITILSLTALVAMTVAALVAFWMQAVITRPIHAIARIARDVVARKQYTQRAVKLSEDEVGVLVDAFNEMLAEIEIRTTALEDSNHELEREIAARTEATTKIQQLNEELEEKVHLRTLELRVANQELESFCYSVSHDLRAPLRSISGFSQALLEELPADLPVGNRHYLERIIAASYRMGQLIEDLLNLSRVSRVGLQPQSVNLTDMVWEVLNVLQNRHPNQVVDLSVWKSMTVQADPKLLRIVLENLLDNAWKFSSEQEKPQIVVGMTKDGVHATYFVRDNGAGFDMKYADKLFAPFQRLHAAHEFPGTGIGLVTVQRIVHRHGGRIWFDAAPGAGATFYFTLGQGGGHHDTTGS